MLTYNEEESLLVLRGLGIQTSTSSPTYLSTATTRFIPTTQIQDMVINEAFKGFEVRYYLSIIVDGESEVVVVFPVRLCHLLWGLPTDYGFRVSSPGAASWKRCGGALRSVYTMRRASS